MNENRRIALNSIVLYIRLILNVIIGLYTSRIILHSLGVNDYGLYCVVGGIVTMMNFLGTAMLSTSYRFLAVEMGKEKNGNLNRVYNTVFIIHIFLAILLLIIGESVGTWYIENYLNVDITRIPDALYVLHWSIFSTMFIIISVPSNGLIVAKERFIFTSFVEIGRSIIKLLLVIGLTYYIGNRIRMFAIIMAIYNLLLPICYTIYCLLKERSTVHFSLNKNWSDYKQIFSYAIWIMFGATTSVINTQGAAIVINHFFTTVMNAAFGIASQINSYIQMLVRSLSQATVPQIMKSYSAGDQKRSLQLVYIICKYSFFLMILPASIVLISIDELLILWLKDVPDNTNWFVLFMLVNAMVYTLECGFDTCIQATGKIRINQLGYGLISISLLPIAYICYLIGAPAYAITMVNIGISICILCFHVYILCKLTDFTVSAYVQNTLYPAFRISIPISIFALFMHFVISIDNILLSFLIKSIISFIVIVPILYFIGFTKTEQKKIFSFIKKIKRI